MKRHITVKCKRWDQPRHYASLRAFADEQNLNYASLVSGLYVSKRNRYKDYSIKRGTDDPNNQVQNRDWYVKRTDGFNKKVQVKCLETGKIYDSITALSKEVGKSSWTLGLKMHSAGKYVDKDGHTYIRLQPMKTRRNYPVQHSPEIVERENGHHSHKKAVVEAIKPSIEEILPAIEQQSTPSMFIAVENVAKELISKQQYEKASIILSALEKIK